MSEQACGCADPSGGGASCGGAEPGGGTSCGGPEPSGGGGSSPRVETLIDRFLAEQASPTAAERFAAEHDDDRLPQARRYQALMPATPPGPGQQYGFEVDLDACTGCKACVTACRNLNGLDPDESWRSVGLLVGEAGGALGEEAGGEPVQQHVTTACHHCVEPGCLQGCPVDAYEKDPDTGIVVHHEDQCIGCGYCTLTCPYEVPRFDAGRGVVRKCDLCTDRLADGEAPACVQACPTHAISVRVVDTADARAAADEPWPIAAPDPAETVPTTAYRTARDLSAAEPADRYALAPSRAHPPLSVMLVLTQLAVGAHLVDLAVALSASGSDAAGAPGPSAAGAVAALAAGAAGLVASLAHLGRPRHAHRAVIGLRHSWLSREIVAFTAFLGLLAADAAVRLAVAAGLDPAPALGSPEAGRALLAAALPAATAAAGVAGVACSAMVYAVTGKRWWRLPRVGARFALTTLTGGLAISLALEVTRAWAAGAEPRAAAWLAAALAALAAAKLAVDAAAVRHALGPLPQELVRSAVLLAGPLRAGLRWRVGLGALGGVALPLWVALLLAGGAAAGPAAVAAWAGAALLAAGELVERWHFFTALSSPGMPGGMR